MFQYLELIRKTLNKDSAIETIQSWESHSKELLLTFHQNHV